MDTVGLIIDGKSIEVPAGTTILGAAKSIGIYIPALCHHPDLPPAKGVPSASAIYQGAVRIVNAALHEAGKECRLCMVEVEGEPDLVESCFTEARVGMVVVTHSDRIRQKRQENLISIMARHRHSCLTCAQKEGCSRTQCSANVSENERCCEEFGHCELQNIADYIGISNATPQWVPTTIPILFDEPLFKRDYNLCIGCTRCVRVCRQLRGIEAIGFVYDAAGRVQVGSLGLTLAESGCKFCMACVEVCPTGALMEKDVEAGKREDDLVPCRAACPVHIDIPGYIRMIAKGKADAANAIIREKVPFPGILGRICIRPCESVCRRGEVNEPIAICALKRYAAYHEKGLWKKGLTLGKDTGKRVAVVGAGPAGLTAAFYLQKKGHAVTVFDAGAEPGGMMRYGIPAYRLPLDVLQKEIDEIFDLGIEFKPNMRLGKHMQLEDLKAEGFDAVFLAIGAQLSRRIPLEGCDLPDVIWGVDFLRDVAHGKAVRMKENVLVIGGGNMAIDVALTALRCGSADVSIACLESEEEMSAFKWAIEDAVAEGVKLLPSWGPERVLSKNGRVTGLDLVECTCVFDEKGNFGPRFGDRKECIMVDQIILAVGRSVDLSFLSDGTPISIENGLILIEQETLETGMKHVFAGGDAIAMPGTVIHAISHGRKASSAIDKALGGDGRIEEVLFPRGAPDPYFGREEGFAGWSRIPVPQIPLGDSRSDFAEIDLGYDQTQARKEARRCLQCDARLYLKGNPAPPENLVAFTYEHIVQLSEAEGVFRLLDAGRNILAIKGTPDLKAELLRALKENQNAVWFEFEEDKLYSKRESELLQRYLQEHGKMPGISADDDDYF